jgi:hypothetical protein
MYTGVISHVLVSIMPVCAVLLPVLLIVLPVKIITPVRTSIDPVFMTLHDRDIHDPVLFISHDHEKVHDSDEGGLIAHEREDIAHVLLDPVLVIPVFEGDGGGSISHTSSLEEIWSTTSSFCVPE